MKSSSRGTRRTGGNRPHPAPFVVGMARSGTTLVRMMLDSHPQLAIPPETWFVLPLLDAFEGTQAPGPERALELIVDYSSWGDFGVEAGDVLARLRACDPLDAAGAIRAFYEAYAQSAGKPRWGDKTPVYTPRIKRIGHALPEARFVNLIRDPRDVVLSMQGLAGVASPPAQIADWWARSVGGARRQARKLPHYLEVRYEDLVTDPEPVLRGVCAFVELDWDRRMLDYHLDAPSRLSREAGRDFEPVKGWPAAPAQARRRAHALVAEPPRRDRIGRWRHEMSPEDVVAVEAAAGPLMVALGYDRHGGPA